MYGGGSRFLWTLARYFSLRRHLDHIQPVPGSRERRWELSTWLMALGGLLAVITLPLASSALTLLCLGVFTGGLLLAVLSALSGND